MGFHCAAFKQCSFMYVCIADRSSMTGVKSMVMRAGRPGMSGIMEVSLSKIRVPATKFKI